MKDFKVGQKHDKSLKSKAKNAYHTAANITSNVEQLAERISLLIVASYNAYDLYARPVSQVEWYIRAGASIIIGLRAADLLVKYFNHSEGDI